MDKMFKSRKIASKDDKTISQTKNESLTSIKEKMKDEGSTLNWSKFKIETSTVRRDKMNRESSTSNLDREKMKDEDKGSTLNWSKLNNESLTSNWDKFKTDSTLTRDKIRRASNVVLHIKRFIFGFVVGVACTLVGVYAFFLPEIEVMVSTFLYAFGNVCSIASTMFVTGPKKQLEGMCDKIRLLTLINMLMYFGLSLCAIFLWTNFGLALLFCILQILSLSCYTLSHTQWFRKFRKLLGFFMK